MTRSPKDQVKFAAAEAKALLGPGFPSNQIIMIPVDQLVPYANNARTHSDKQVGMIARSYEAFGFLNPILVTSGNVVIAGHGRMRAAQRLGLTAIPALFVEGLSDDQIRAYRLADNRLAELAGWDEPSIKIEMQHLDTIDLGFSLEATGWEMPQIDIMLNDAPPPAVRDGVSTDPDDVAEPILANATSRVGDIWLLGTHRLACGSALEPDVLRRVMNGKLARQVLQDPPWNISVAGFISTTDRHREFAMASGEMTEGEFQAFLDKNLDTLLPFVVNGAILEQFIDWRSVDKIILSGKSRGLELINICVWNKSNGSLGSLWRSKHELCVVFKKPGAPHINAVQLGRFGRTRYNVWDFPGCNSFSAERDEALAIHPTAKSVAMIGEAMRDVSNRGDIVLDCFMGSGTAIIAAERTGRIAFGVELDPLYVDAAVRRWQRITGGVATLEANGMPFAEVVEERSGSDLAPVVDTIPVTPKIRHRPRPAAVL